MYRYSICVFDGLAFLELFSCKTLPLYIGTWIASFLVVKNMAYITIFTQVIFLTMGVTINDKSTITEPEP